MKLKNLHEGRSGSRFEVAELLAEYLRDLPGNPTIHWSRHHPTASAATVIVKRPAPHTPGFDQIAKILIWDDGGMKWNLGLCVRGDERIDPTIAVSCYKGDYHDSESFERIKNQLKGWFSRS